MAAAGENHQLFTGMVLKIAGGALGHALVPQQLDGEKALEVLVRIRVLALAPLLLLQLLSFGMQVEDRLDPLPVGGVAAIDLRGDAGALLRGQGLQPTLADLGGDLPLQIQGDDGDAMLPGEAQDGPIEAVVEAPALEVVRAPQHFALVDLPGDIGIQGRLEGLLEHLHADGQVRAPLVQPTDDRQLIEVVLIAIMGLADENHPTLRQAGDQGLEVGQVGQIDHGGAGIQELVLPQGHGCRRCRSLAKGRLHQAEEQEAANRRA